MALLNMELAMMAIATAPMIAMPPLWASKTFLVTTYLVNRRPLLQILSEVGTKEGLVDPQKILWLSLQLEQQSWAKSLCL
jgi:hypothetical protein